MPIYEFSCPRGHVTERLASMDTEAIECPECGQEAPRRMSAPAGFDFRGPGFYATDYAAKPTGKEGGGEKGSDAGSQGAGGQAGGGGSGSEAGSGSGSGGTSSTSSVD